MEPCETSLLRTTVLKESKCAFHISVCVCVSLAWCELYTDFAFSFLFMFTWSMWRQPRSRVCLLSLAPFTVWSLCRPLPWQNTTATVEQEWPFQPMVKMWLWEKCLKTAQLWETLAMNKRRSEAHSVITSTVTNCTMKKEWIENNMQHYKYQ